MNQLSLNKLRQIKKDLQYSLQDFMRELTLSSEIINQKEIRVTGMKRSGNHAIINWIWKQQGDDGVMHLNNIPAKYNPYRFLYEHFGNDKLRQESEGNFSQKDLLIYSYEDQTLEDISDLKFAKKHDIYLGKSLESYDVLILRDPFNCFASRAKKFAHRFNAVDNPNIVTEKSQASAKLWISYAKEYLGETHYLKNKKIPINFNLWTTDQEYRRELASKLNLEFSDAEFDRVKGAGGGSSFEGLSKRYEGSTMKVNERWKLMADHPYMVAMLENKELIAYSNKIFGHIAGTESLGS
jgi:hypothetical protein